MDKTELICRIIAQLEQQLDNLLHASEQAHRSATHAESKAENKYDTRGLEAAYLAHGLSVRVEELQFALTSFRQWTPGDVGDDDVISVGALVTLESEASVVRQVLLAPQGGGLKVDTEDGTVTVVTPSAPLGRALVGKQLDDELSLDVRGGRSVYDVIAIE